MSQLVASVFDRKKDFLLLVLSLKLILTYTALEKERRGKERAESQ